MTNEPVPLQYLVKGIKSEKFLDSSFLGDLDKIFKYVRVVNISIVVGNEDQKDIISIGYPNPKYEKNNELIIDSNFPGTIDKIIELISKEE